MKKTIKPSRKVDVVAQRLIDSEQLFRQFVDLTPFVFKPFGKSFSSWEDYERWKNAQKNPWYR